MKICYFGNYDPNYSRNRVILKGLIQNNVQVFEVNIPQKSGISRFWKLYQLHKKYKGSYDSLIIGFSDTSATLAIFAKFLTRKPVIWDAFYSIYDSWVFDRKLTSPWGLKALYYFVMEWLACALSDKVLLDTHSHIDYFVKTFRVKREKFIRVLVGTDPDVFLFNSEYKNDDIINIEFHGTYIPLQGIEYIVQAAKLLESKTHITFTLVGNGQEFPRISKLVRDLNVTNIIFSDRVAYAELPHFLKEADISLGIFGLTGKATRVIPNKVYEAISVGAPVITADTPAIRELFADGENIILCEPSNPESLASKILEVASDRSLREKIRIGGRKIFEEQCTPKIIGEKLLFDLKK